jgi:hypothetical protein
MSLCVLSDKGCKINTGWKLSTEYGVSTFNATRRWWWPGEESTRPASPANPPTRVLHKHVRIHVIIKILYTRHAPFRTHSYGFLKKWLFSTFFGYFLKYFRVQIALLSQAFLILHEHATHPRRRFSQIWLWIVYEVLNL